MRMIVITTTATLRPDILERTLSSFRQYMFTDDILRRIRVEMVINIDPAGPGDVREVMDVPGRYFSVIATRNPVQAGFPAAFRWAWSKAAESLSALYVFHLEDDWILSRPIDVLDMIRVLESNPDLAVLRLPAFHAGTETMKNWNLHFPWNGSFYECPEDLKITAGFCGHPSLIRMEFVKNSAHLLEGDRNPEKQFHRGGPPELLREVLRWRYGVYASPGSLPAIRDIGREWMVKNNLSKAGSKAFFTHWERYNA